MISRHKKLDMLSQIKIIHKAYFMEDEKSVNSYFERCGITGDTTPEKVLQKLYFDGVYPTSKFRSLHKEQLISYLDWKYHGKKTISDVFGAEFEILFDQKR